MSDENPSDQDSDHEQGNAAQPGEADATGTGRSKRESQAKREQREADAFWDKVFESEVGRREMYRIACSTTGAHAFETRFPCGPSGVPDPNAAWYEKGAQDFGLRLYHAWLKRNPTAIGQMHFENDPRFSTPKRKTGE